MKTQIVVQMARIDAPLGRPLNMDETVEVTWTINLPDDEEVMLKNGGGSKGKIAKRQHRLRRLLTEAEFQHAAPTLDDLAEALGVGVATIKRDFTVFRKEGLTIKTRGSKS